MTIQHLAYRIAHEYPGGVVRLAEEMGKGAQVLTNKLNPNTDTHHVTIGELAMIADFTDSNVQVAEHFAHKANHAVVPLPADDAIVADMALLDGFMELSSDYGTFAYEFKKAFEDGVLTTAEFERLRNIQLKTIGKMLAYVKRIEGVVR